MPTLDAAVKFEIWCECGEGLCTQTSVEGVEITVDPCSQCMDRAFEEGKEEGYSSRDAEVEELQNHISALERSIEELEAENQELLDAMPMPKVGETQ